MLKYISAVAVFFLCFACNRPQPVGEKPASVVVLRFELDTAGNIANENVKQQLAEIAVRISRNADRVMLHSYTEKLHTPDEEIALANELARAAKQVMVQSAPSRMYYNVGIDAHGYTHPVDTVHPQSHINRRIEVEFL
jgi:hypothetical protein